MISRLGRLIADTRSLSLAGMCKNAGKTTVFNCMIRELNQTELVLGLTSIGRDGEATDIVTGTHKPGIYVQEGTIIGTAAGLLQYCDITKEIVGKSGIQTPMGEVILIRARSDGFVQLAGPSMNSQLIELSSQFKELGVDKVMIDGAISRKSLCSTKVAESVILSTGASLHKSMDEVVRETQYVATILDLPAVDLNLSIEIQNPDPMKMNVVQLYDSRKEMIQLHPSDSGVFQLHELLRHKSYHHWKYCYLTGALTDVRLKPLLMSNLNIEDRQIVVEDSSKILLSRDCYNKMIKKGCSLAVSEETKLLGITINPFSAYGHHFQKDEFMEKMQCAVRQPVWNVLEEEQWRD